MSKMSIGSTFVILFLIILSFGIINGSAYNWKLSDDSEGYIIETDKGLIPHFYKDGNKVIYETDVNNFLSVVMKIDYNGSYMYNYMVLLRVSNDSGLYYERGFGCVYGNSSFSAEWEESYNSSFKWSSHYQVNYYPNEIKISVDDINIDGVSFYINNINKVQLIFIRNFVPQFTNYNEETVYFMIISDVIING